MKQTKTKYLMRLKSRILLLFFLIELKINYFRSPYKLQMNVAMIGIYGHFQRFLKKCIRQLAFYSLTVILGLSLVSLLPQSKIEAATMKVYEKTGQRIYYAYNTSFYDVELVNVDGQQVWCIEPENNSPGGKGSNYTFSRIESNQTRKLLNVLVFDTQGFDAKYPRSHDQKYITGWLAFQIVLNNKWTSLLGKGDGYLDAIVDYARNGTYSEYSLNISPTSSTSIYDSTNKQLISTASFTAFGSTTTFNVSGLPSGYYVTDVNGIKITSKLSTGQKFRIATTNLSATTSFSFSLSNHGLDNHGFFQYESSSANIQDAIGGYISDPVAINSVSISYTPALGSIKLTKSDENKSALYANVEFMLSSSASEAGKISNYKTGSDGSVTISNLTPGTYYYKEVSVPDKLEIDTSWKAITVSAGQTNAATVYNNLKDIRMTVQHIDNRTKVVLKEETKVYHIDDAYSFSYLNNLKRGNYTYQLVGTTTSVSGTTKLSDQNRVIKFYYDTPLIQTDLTYIKIDTAKTSTGLPFEVQLSNSKLYDASIADYSNTKLWVRVYDTSNNTVVYEKNLKLSELTSSITGTIKTGLTKNTNKTYEARLEGYSDDVIVKQQKITADGYTSSEATLSQVASISTTLSSKRVIRTERYYGQALKLYYESITIATAKLERLRTGRGFSYDVSAMYSNDLGQSYPVTLTFNPDSKLVDGDFYTRSGSQAIIPLTLNDEGIYELPHVYSEKGLEGTIVSETTYLAQTNRENYRDGDHKIYTPLWTTDLGTYSTSLITNKVGVNEVTLQMNDSLELFAFFYGWMDENGSSPTIKDDGIIVSPVVTNDKNGNGIPDMWDDGYMPDNWGVLQADGSKVLSLEEKAYFGLLGKVAVSYNLTGGSGTFTGEEITEGSSYKLSTTIPTKTDYTFAGWRSSADGKLYTSGASVKILEDTVFTAEWISNTFTVSYNANGGSGVPGSQIKTSETALVLSNIKPTRTGYTFKNWNTKADGSGTSYSSGSSYTVNASLTLYAQWTLNTYTVTFNLNGGTGSIANQTVNYGAKATIPNTPSRTGYTFSGWSPSINSAITGNTTFVAQWSANTYSVTFNSNGGSGAPGSQIKIHGTTLTLSSTKPTRTGYTFKNWNTAANGSGTSYAPGNTYTGNSAVTLYAQWTANTFSVTYNANGGSGAPGNQTKTYGVALTLSSTKPTRSGYNFLRWNTTASGSGTSVAPGDVYGTNASLTLYAQWEKKYDTIYLKPHVTSWRVYNISTGAQVATLNPNQFGGLTYRVDYWITKGTWAVITTEMFGQVKIYLDSDAIITYAN